MLRIPAAAYTRILVPLLVLVLVATGFSFSIAAVQGGSSWVERYRKALEIDPDNAALRYQLGLSLLASGENEPAVEELHRAYPSLSQTIGINFNLGLAYTRLNDADSALLYLEQAEASGAGEQPEIYPLASALYNVALVYLDKGEKSDAIDVLAHVLKLAPERRDLMRLYGEVLYREGRMAEAEQQLLGYLDLYPDDNHIRDTLFALYYNRGLSEIEEKKYQQAVASFEQALGIEPESPMALYYLAYLEYQQQKPARVVEHLAEQVESFPPDVQRSSFPLLYNSTLTLLNQGENELAARGVSALISSGKDDVKYLSLAGRVALANEDFSASRELYSRVLTIDPAHAEALQNLSAAEKALAKQRVSEGQVLYRKGDLQAAYSMFIEAQTLDPLDPTVMAYLKDTRKRLESAADEAFEKAEQAETAGDDILALKKAREGRRMWSESKRGQELERRLLGKLDLVIARRTLEAQSHLANQKYAEAVAAFSELLEIEPGNDDALRGLKQAKASLERRQDEQLKAGFAALENGDLKTASAVFEKVLAERPGNPEALEGLQRIAGLREVMIGDELQWARRAFSDGDYRAAREHFQNVLRQHDTPPLRNEYLAFESSVEKRLAGLLKAARASRAEYDFKKALGYYRQARELAADPGSINAEYDATLREADEIMLSRLEEARASIDAGESGKAVRLLREVLKIEPSQSQALALMKKARNVAREEALNLFAKGREYRQDGRLEEARKAFSAALKIDPYMQAAREALDAIDIETRKMSKALVERLYLEGVALYTRGEYKQAIASWQKVLKMDKGHDKARRNLNKAVRKLKQLEGRG